MKNLIKLFSALLIALLFTFNIAKAQTWTNYTTADGLPWFNVYSCAIDLEDNKWFGTDGYGVSKFDGINWTTYTTNDGLVDNHLNSNAMAIDPDGNKWFGTYYGGISKFDGLSWTSYTTANGLIDNSVLAITFDHQGNTWFGTYAGVSKFDGVNWTNNSTLGFVWALAVDTSGNIWAGTQSGVFMYNGVSWTHYTTADGLASDNVRGVAIDAQQNLWFGTVGAGLTKFDGVNWTTYTIANGLCSNSIIVITTDAGNNLWIGTYGGGVSKFDGTNWTTYTTVDGLISDYVSAISIDNHGNKWFATWNNVNGGVSRFSDGGPGPISSNCLLIGSIYNDINQNGILDSGETKLPGKIVEVLNDSTFSTTQSNGNFYINRDSGVYNIKCLPISNWHFTTDSIITINVSDSSSFIDGINFGISPVENISDISVDITGGTARASFNVNYWLTYSNEATVTKNGTVVLKIDSLTSFVSSTPPPDSQNGNLITWNYTNLVPFEQRQVQLFLHMPDVSHLGDTLTTTAIINPVPGDMAPLNNYDTLHQVLTGSYDPNDKSVNKGTREQGYTLFGEELTYTIRFQNTGTDTAFTVQIRDTIDSDLDMASLRIVSSSHNVRLDVKNENVVTFIFENILLPDSNVNEPASNGFVKFAIKPKPGLAEYTEVTNKAYIFFDFNPAVVTNEVLNTYVSNPFSGIEDISIDDQLMNLYPNPAMNFLTIETIQPSQIEILNLQGQIIYESNFNEKNTSIDVSWFPAGLYFIKMSTAGNYAVAKFIKQ